MTRALVLFAAVVLVFAAWVLTHLAALWLTARSDVAPRLKWLALVPVLTPIAAWKAERRGAAVTWGILGIAYGVLRFITG